MLHTVLMVNTDGQITVRADEDTLKSIPLAEQFPCMYGVHPSSWVFQKHPITEEEARRYAHVFTSRSWDQRALDTGAARACAARRCPLCRAYSVNDMS
eukprot:1261246-Pyramimonas_sp.AAC.2